MVVRVVIVLNYVPVGDVIVQLLLNSYQHVLGVHVEIVNLLELA